MTDSSKDLPQIFWRRDGRSKAKQSATVTRPNGTEVNWSLTSRAKTATHPSKSWRLYATVDKKPLNEDYRDEAAAKLRVEQWRAREWRRQRREVETSLSDEQLRQAETAVFLLKEQAVTLTDVVRFFLDRQPKRTLSVSEAVTAFLKHGKDFGHSIRTQNDYRLRLKDFLSGFGNRPVTQVSVEELTKLVTGGPNQGQRTKMHQRRSLHAFYGFCEDRGWVTENPVSRVSKLRVAAAKKEIFSLDECRRLFAAAEHFDEGEFLPYLALTTFCGIRPSEVGRLVWADIDLRSAYSGGIGSITLSGSKTKGGFQRTFSPIPDNARAILLRSEGKPLRPKVNFEARFMALRAEAGLTRWPNDVLRHTAISFYVAKFHDLSKASTLFGNDIKTIRAHYLNRVDVPDIDPFYDIGLTPPALDTNRQPQTH
jgi:integrase